MGVANFYNSGDLVDINCTSFESKPAANVTWKVNDQPVRGHSYIMSARFGGWVYKMNIFADVQYCIYAKKVGG